MDSTVKIVVDEVERIVESFKGFEIIHEGVGYVRGRRVDRIFIVVEEGEYLDNVTIGGDGFMPTVFPNVRGLARYGIAVFDIQDKGLEYDHNTTLSDLDGTILEFNDPRFFDNLRGLVKGLHERFN